MGKQTTITHPDGTRTVVKTTGGCGCGNCCLWSLLILFVVGSIGTAGSGTLATGLGLIVVCAAALAIGMACLNRIRSGKWSLRQPPG